MEPEHSLQFDVSARYDARRWRLAAAIYRYDISIERYQSGTDTFLFRNRGLAELRGVEIEGRVDFPAVSPSRCRREGTRPRRG
jgi:outer membrane receptor protein involved in Fe transport